MFQSLLKRVEEKIGRTIGQLKKNDLDILKLKKSFPNFLRRSTVLFRKLKHKLFSSYLQNYAETVFDIFNCGNV